MVLDHDDYNLACHELLAYLVPDCLVLLSVVNFLLDVTFLILIEVFVKELVLVGPDAMPEFGVHVLIREHQRAPFSFASAGDVPHRNLVAPIPLLFDLLVLRALFMLFVKQFVAICTLFQGLCVFELFGCSGHSMCVPPRIHFDLGNTPVVEPLEEPRCDVWLVLLNHDEGSVLELPCTPPHPAPPQHPRMDPSS